MKQLELALVFAGLMCLAVAAHADPIRVLFDEAHDELNTISEAQARVIDRTYPEWVFYNHLAETVSGECDLVRGLSPLVAEKLQDFDVVIIATPRAAFTDEELQALRDFVERGGGLLLLQDANPSNDVGSNQIAGLFGTRFRHGVLRSEHGDWDPESFRVDVVQSEHFIVRRPTEFQANWSCSIEETPEWDVLLESREDTWQDSNGNGREDAGEPSGPLSVAAARDVGEGRVVLIADNAFHDNAWGLNQGVFLDLLDWLSGKEHATYMSNVPSFDVDSDVTLDSVVQVGDGPQELSTEIKFYPNTRRAKPGDTVYWTLEIGEGSGLEPPFSITPEMDNDLAHEAVVRTSARRTIIANVYAEPNLYRPIVELRDSRGHSVTIYSHALLEVLTELEQRTGVGIKIATPESPEGDVIKGGQLLLVDHNLFGTRTGVEWIEKEITRWHEDGMNAIVLNILWFVEHDESNIYAPIYENAPQPYFFTGTLALNHLIVLTDILHEQGFKVGWLFGLTRMGDHTTTSRFDFAPSDLDLYFESQILVKTYYARVAETMGVELFGLDTENRAFSLGSRSVQVYTAVREVYDGAIFDATLSGWGDQTSMSPLTPMLDLIFYSSGPGFDKSHSRSQMAGRFQVLLRYDILEDLYDYQKAGIIEIPVEGKGMETYQAEGYDIVMSQLSHANSPLQGVTFWGLELYPGWSNPMFTPIGNPAETVMQHYFADILPEKMEFSFQQSIDHPVPRVDLASFEQATPREFEVLKVLNGECSVRLTEDADERSGVLRVNFQHTGSYHEVGWYILQKLFGTPVDLSDCGTVSYCIRNDGNPCGVTLSLWDEDGDKFSAANNLSYRPDEWQFFSIPLSAFASTYRGPDADGVLDLMRITRFEISEGFWEPGQYTTFLGRIYAGVERCASQPPSSDDSPSQNSGGSSPDSDGDPEVAARPSTARRYRKSLGSDAVLNCQSNARCSSWRFRLRYVQKNPLNRL